MVTEGTAATFVVELSGESRKTVTVSYETADGTALAGEDYPAVALTELEFTFRSHGADDQRSDDGRRVGRRGRRDVHGDVERSRERGSWRLADATTATGTIDDNDDEPKVSITGTPVVVEGTAATFVVELSGESRKTVTVSYATADGTALAGEDYPAVELTELEFSSGVTAQTISVATTDDGLDEEDGETFTVTLSAPGNAELAAGGETATGTIDDNDGEPKVSITGTPVVTEGTAATFVVELSGESRKTVTVSYETADGTALAGEDYPEVDATELEFTSGVTAQTISVATTDDGLDEEDGETFTVTLSAPGNAAAGGGRRDGDGDDRRQRRRAEGEHHGSAGGDRGNRGVVRGGAERGEPQDSDGELQDGGRYGAGERGLHGGGVDGAGVQFRSHGADDQRSDDGGWV